MIADEIEAPEFADACRGLPAYVASGTADISVRFRTVERGIAAPERIGADVTFDPSPGGDHSLLFGRRLELLGRIAAWTDRHRLP